ncbi:hypothetical protein UlMin_016620 [Ulmus minor]
MKIDLQKAYDHLSWNFLKSVFTAFGFHPKWIRWVLLCCSTASMTLILHEAAFQSFRPKRGLRQGDPISPYLFILCVEVLSRLINQEVFSGRIAGLISSLLGFDKISPSSAYLGLPLFRSGWSEDFNFLVEKLDTKLAGWKSKVLSKAKRLVLIKSIALSLPVYTMQSMKLPKSISSKLDAIIRNFWWSASKSNNPLCLKA